MEDLNLNFAIVPICNQEGIQATGFIIKYDGYYFLITAGHTFESTESIASFWFIYKKDHYYLKDFLKHYRYEPILSDDMIYHDYSFFKLVVVEWDALELIPLYEYGNDSFDCFGFERDGLLRKVPRTGAKCTFPTLIAFEAGHSSKVINCGTKYGYCIRGYSGGPILIPDSTKVVGMTVIGNCDERTSDINKRQHFIVSDFLIQQLNILSDEYE